MDLRGKSKETIDALKKRIEELFADGLGVTEVCQATGIWPYQLRALRKEDQMLNWRIKKIICKMEEKCQQPH